MDPNEVIIYDENNNPIEVMIMDELDPNGEPVIVPYDGEE